MIVGIGIDIIEIERVEEIFLKWGQSFLDKVFTESEISYCTSKAFPAQHLAARFACKEAFYKAAAERLNIQMGWKSIEIINSEQGKPTVKINDSFHPLFENIDIHLSISHSTKYASATVLLETKTN